MRIGIGLPAAVPATDMTSIGRWAAESERAGFASVGVIDRLVYDNVDPLTALSAAAACTRRIELISSVINVCWRNNPLLLAKQLWSVDRLSGGRLTAGLGMGGWPADYEAGGVTLAGRGARFDAALAAMERAWQTVGARPSILLGGTAPASLARAASPVSGDDYFEPARADTITDVDQLREELQTLERAGCDDVVLFPCSGDLEQVRLLADALRSREPIGGEVTV